MRNWQICPELTNICNMKCVLCPHSIEGTKGRSGNSYNREKGLMSQELWYKCLAVAGKYARELSIGFFGEQTMHPFFRNAIASIPTYRKYRVVLNSNWSYVSKRDFDIHLLSIDELRISIDAINPETYVKICQPQGSFYDIGGRICAIDRDYLPALEEKILDWVNNPHPKTKLIFTLSTYNISEKEKFLSKWINILPRQDSVCVKSCISFGGVMRNPIMSRAKCSIPRERRMVIAHDGTCSPCNLDVNMALSVGNINDVKDMSDIVRSKKYRSVMASIRKRRGICANCFDGNNRRLTRNYRGRRLK